MGSALSASRSIFFNGEDGFIALPLRMRLAAQAILPEIQGNSKLDSETDAPGESGGSDAMIAETARQIVRDYGAFVWRTLRHQGVVERDLEDASQEVFVIVFRKLSLLERPSSLRAWIYGITIRVAAGHRRRLRTHHEVLVNELPDVSAADSPEADRLHARRQLVELLARLDDDKRAVFVLHELEGLGMEEIAEIVGCPVGTGYSRLLAARKQILSMLSRMPKESK